MELTKIIAKARQAREARDNGQAVKPFPPEWENAFTYEQLERLAIRTICGQMTDHEALRAEALA